MRVGTYCGDGEDAIVGLDLPHDIPPREDSCHDEEDHQHQECVGGDRDVSGMVVGRYDEQRRKGPRHGRVDSYRIQSYLFTRMRERKVSRIKC